MAVYLKVEEEKCGCLFFSMDSSPNINSQALQVIFANCYYFSGKAQ